MHVGVERPLGGEPRGAPVLPVVEVPAQLAEHPVGLPERQVGPGGPLLLVGLAEEADVVDLEARRAPLVGGLEHQPPAAHLGEPELQVGAGERGPGRVVLQRAVRPLVEVDRAALRPGDRLGLAGHPAPVQRARHLVPAAGEPAPRVQPRGVGAAVEPRLAGLVERAVHRGDDEAEAAVAAGEVLVPAGDGVVGRGLQRAGGAGDVVGDRVEDAEGEAPRQAAGDLAGAQDPGRGGRRRVAVVVGELRRAPDPAGVEQALAGVAVHHHDAVHPEREQPLALDEEGSPLLEEGLERAEVELRRVGLDLAEVGVHRRVEQEVGGDPVLEVAPDGELLVSRVAVRRCPLDVLGQHVGRDLGVARAREPLESGQLAELRGEARARRSVEGPGDGLAVALDDPPDQEAEADAALGGVVELGERDPVLGGPAERVDPGGHVPHRVPGDVLVRVVVDRVVRLHPRGAHHELVPRAAVVIGVEHQDDLVGGRLLVAAGEEADDAVGGRVEGADEDVQVVGVVGHPCHRAEAGRSALAGPGLEKSVYGGGRAPDGVLIGAVERRRLGRPRGPHRGRGRERGSRRRRLCLQSQQQPEPGAHRVTLAGRLRR